jgi:hypothetical protein
MKKRCSDTNIDDSLKELDSHLIWKKKHLVKNRILTEIDNLPCAEIKFTKRGSIKRKLVYPGILAILLLGLISSSAFYSPALAEVISKVPFLSGFDNRIQLQKHPGEVGAYLNLVSAYNKGNKEAYLDSYSNKLSSHSLQKLEGNFDRGVKEEHLFSTGLDLIYSSEKTAILLSKESHSYKEEVRYGLDSYVILNKENGEWKVLETLPFKKAGRGNYGSTSNFDNTEEVTNKIEQTYDIKLGKAIEEKAD